MTTAAVDMAADLDWRNYNRWPFPGPPWRLQAESYGHGWKTACRRLALEDLGGGWWGITERTPIAAAQICDQQLTKEKNHEYARATRKIRLLPRRRGVAEIAAVKSGDHPERRAN